MAITNHIKITNISEKMLTNVTLCLNGTLPELSKLLVVRERGSLDFAPDTSKICLGNLYPEETAYLYYTIGNDKPEPKTSLSTKQNIKILFTPEGKEDMTDNTKKFINFEHFN